MRIQFSLSTIYTFLEEIARIIDSEYIILYVDPFSRIPLYTYISCNGPLSLVIANHTSLKRPSLYCLIHFYKSSTFRHNGS